ncbi:spore coat protein YlbD [Aliibacillus thermotolerans]|uniref:Spore coat protein YlbD n=1 Tax=Aliibacillus thermotolerans TaxID=1834418 RepID=A0ABW0U571_9BACI|nr:spore coat protein YlbD [Aliibacillus thermotolerans]MDA3131038.1 hypothetical protein [Aliibacillus thermotolerans]
MDREKLSPMLVSFREFLHQHPRLIAEVREGKRTWNELYQDWYVLGEDHEDWLAYKKENKNEKETESFAPILAMLKNINFDELQQHISQVNGVIGHVQKMLEQFQKSPRNDGSPQDPFTFREY